MTVDWLKAAHHTRMQLTGILCERGLTKEETILHDTSCRLLTRFFILQDAALRDNNEDPTRIPDSGPKEIPPGPEPGLLSSN